MEIIEMGNKYYPSSLLEIEDSPKKLYVLGNKEILNGFGIAIVGSRICTKYGEEMAKSLAYNLSKHNVNIISGMAKGIDKCAHEGCIMGCRKNYSSTWKRI